MNTLITEFVVTEQCNLACEYCYMKNNNIYMDIDKVKLYIENVHKIMEFYGCSQYHISYFGGEPLLNWELIKNAIPLFKEDPRCNSQVIISNGFLLTQDIIDYIKSYGVGFSWSFDGIWQDENRPHVIFSDTISKYKENKELIYQISQTSKVMISPNNIDTLTENLEFFVDEFQILNPDFSLVRDDIWSDTDVDKFKIESRRLADRIIEYYENGMNVSVGLYNLALMDMVQGSTHGKRPFGCFAGCHGVGYFPNGDFYPCARFGVSKEYLLMDSHGTLNRENIIKLNQSKITDPRTFKECDDCRLRLYCNAGCTYSQLKINDSGELSASPISSVCELFKIVYDDTMYINDKLKNNDSYKNYMNSLIKSIGE